MFSTSELFADWIMIQIFVMILSILTLGKAQSQRVQRLLLGSLFHGSLSVAIFGLWHFMKPLF